MNIDYPFRFDQRGHTANTTTANHVRDLIEQLLFTNPGERVNRPNFGSGLMQLIFAGNSPELAATLQFTMQAAIQQWLGDIIQLQALRVETLDSSLHIHLQYALRNTPDQVEQRTIVRAF